MHPILLIIIAITVIISIMGFQNIQLFEKYKFNVSAIQNRKEYIRLLSAGFLHADWGHLFFNMLTLYFFAPIVLYVYGVSGFLLVYLGSIVIGNLFSLYLYKKQSWYSAIGASGGVSGILFAAVAYAPNEIEVNFLPGYIFGALYFGYSVYMMLNPRPHENIGHKKKDGHKPECYYHPNFEYLANAARNKHEEQVRGAVKSVYGWQK